MICTTVTDLVLGTLVGIALVLLIHLLVWDSGR